MDSLLLGVFHVHEACPRPSACLFLGVCSHREKIPTSIVLSNALCLSLLSFLTTLSLCSQVSSFYCESCGVLITIGEIP